MSHHRISLPVTAATAKVYSDRCRRYGFRNATSMMAAALTIVARLVTAPTREEWEELGEEIARTFAAEAEAESMPWGVGYKQKRNRCHP